MLRMIFSKTGNAIWISHLDTMRLFQRAFKRSGLLLKHTQGFNPRPSVSIALPLSVGVESACELLDFELDGQDVPCQDILTRLNTALVPGVQVLAVYEDGKKIKYLRYLRCQIVLEYDSGIPEGAVQAISDLFAQPDLIIEKKSKNGITQQDIIPMIREISMMAQEQQIVLNALICCQEPSLNPNQLIVAITKYLPQYQPDFCKCSRLELYDADGNIFR